MASNSYADAYNAQTEAVLREIQAGAFNDDIAVLPEEEQAELDALVAEAEEALRKAQAGRQVREAEEAAKRAALQAEEDAIRNAAEKVDAAKREKAAALSAAERARIQSLYTEWAKANPATDVMDAAVVAHEHFFDQLARQEYVEQAREVFEQRLGQTAPPAACWNPGSTQYEWSVPVFGGALLLNIRLVHENIIRDDVNTDLLPEVTLQQGTVLPPHGVIFLPNLAALGRVLAEYPSFRAELEKVSN